MGLAARAPRDSPCRSGRAMRTHIVVARGGIFMGATGATWVERVAAQSAVDLTVDELIDRALSDNPELKAIRADVDAALGRRKQAGLRPNPMLELGGQKALSPDNNLNVGLSLPLDLNGRRDGRVAVAEGELRMKRAQVAEAERRVRAEVRMKAGELLAARRNLGVTDELLKVNREALTLVRNRVRGGASPTLDENLQLREVGRAEAGREPPP